MRTRGRCGALGLLWLSLAACACGESREPDGVGGPVALRRLTEAQYRQTIADVFGEGIEVVGRFEPGVRRDGLLAVGTAHVTITPSGFERYESIARGVAAQVVSPEHRAAQVPCRPAVAEAPDPECTAAFVRDVGRRLLRRPLDNAEVQARVEIAAAASQEFGDFYVGVEFALASLLLTPEFLFRAEETRALPDREDATALTDASLAQRLSFFLWNTTPDDELLAAAARGELAEPEVLQAQVDRMLTSPRLEAGVRAYFADVLRFDELDDVSKDTTLYPKYSRKLLVDAREQTLRVVADHLVAQRADYRTLFTTRRSFMTRELGLVYGVPVRPREGWEAVRFAPDDPRAGLLTHVSTLALHSHPGRTSATLRGLFIREAILCQEVPAAPADVDFSVVQDTANPDQRTARARLGAHRTEPSCTGCHELMDPIGLALEHFDGIGAYRREENGEPIDASGRFGDVSYDDAVGLGHALEEDAAITACAIENLYKYAVGHEPSEAEQRLLRGLEKRFAAAGYRFPDLMRMIATSQAFRTAPAGLLASPADSASAGGPDRSRT